MKVTKNQVVTMVSFIVSSLLLIAVASCSLDKQAACNLEHKHNEEAAGEHHAAEEHFEGKGLNN